MSWIVLGEERGKIKLISKSTSKNELPGLLPKGSYLTVENEETNSKFIMRIDDSVQFEPYKPSPLVIDMNLGGLYGVPHGLANAVVLPHVLEAYGEKIYKKLAKLALLCDLGNQTDDTKELALKFITWIKELNQKMGIPFSIKELQQNDIPVIVSRALAEGNPDYPVPVIFDKILMENTISKLKT